MPLSPEDEEQIRQSLCAVYGFAKAEMDVTCVEQPAAAKVSAPDLRPLGQAGREAASPPERVLMGNPIKTKPVPMKMLDLKMATPRWPERCLPLSGRRPGGQVCGA